jgi:hypothetical protein
MDDLPRCRTGVDVFESKAKAGLPDAGACEPIELGRYEPCQPSGICTTIRRESEHSR